MQIDVVKSTDSNRGFRLFDNAVFVVRDVASEELFLDRIRIARAVFEKVVEPYMDSSMLVLARQIVLATQVCISQYFNAQSLARTNRPFIIGAEYRDSPTLFCGCSDFLRAYLYTKTTGDPFLDDKEQNEPVNDPFTNPVYQNHHDSNTLLTDAEMEREACRLKWQLGSLQAKWMVEGGPTPDFNIINPDAINADRTFTDIPARPEAMLYVIADITAISEYLSYMFYMTPVELRRRYEVTTGCSASSVNSSADRLTQQARACCYEQSNRYNSTDTVRRAIQEYLRKKQEAKSIRRDETCNVDPFLEEMFRKENQTAKITRLRKRNDTLVESLLLLLFDKSLSTIIDNGFDNANKRRRYGTNSKSIGGATVYTGILDTVGKVLVRYKEGNSLQPRTLKPVQKVAPKTFLNLRLPLNGVGGADIISE